MEVVLYSTNCPKCQVLEKKLAQKIPDFTIVTDKDKVVEVGRKYKIMSAPILQVGNAFFSFTDANNWLNDQPEKEVEFEKECGECKL